MSYRSGRFGFTAAHVSALERFGYLVESSVAPLFFEAHKGGPDFVEARLEPYFLAYDSAVRPGTSRVSKYRVRLHSIAGSPRRWPTPTPVRRGRI